MKTSIKISGIAAAAAALLATGASTAGHSVDASSVIALGDKKCGGGSGCETHKGGEKKKEVEKKEFAGGL